MKEFNSIPTTTPENDKSTRQETEWDTLKNVAFEGKNQKKQSPPEFSNDITTAISQEEIRRQVLSAYQKQPKSSEKASKEAKQQIKSLNDGKPKSMDLVRENPERAAKDFSEGDSKLESLLLSAWGNGLETSACCCDGIAPYVAFLYDENNSDTFAQMIDTLSSRKGDKYDFELTENLLDNEPRRHFVVRSRWVTRNKQNELHAPPDMFPKIQKAIENHKTGQKLAYIKDMINDSYSKIEAGECDISYIEATRKIPFGQSKLDQKTYFMKKPLR